MLVEIIPFKTMGALEGALFGNGQQEQIEALLVTRNRNLAIQFVDGQYVKAFSAGARQTHLYKIAIAHPDGFVQADSFFEFQVRSDMLPQGSPGIPFFGVNRKSGPRQLPKHPQFKKQEAETSDISISHLN